jgi:stearoyl-CoA desaturase (delta-9 desaturase)
MEPLSPSMAAKAASSNYVLQGYKVSLAQKAHAASIIVVPTLAVLLAGYYLWKGEVRIWEPVLMVMLYLLTMLGITVGFHRLFSHQTFQCHSMVRFSLAVLGCMAAQGPLIYWVSNHRRHHRFGDGNGDPHSPHRLDDRELEGWRGFWHAHFGWTFTHQLTNSAFFCKDLLKDSQITWVNQRYFHWVLLGLLIPTVIGGVIDPSWHGLWRGLLWGGGVRLFFTHHAAASINSITHMFGYRSFATIEQSRNNIWLGYPTLGEGWHNNHHAHPTSAIFGLRWWELDGGGIVIQLLERIGLVWNVRRAYLKNRA